MILNSLNPNDVKIGSGNQKYPGNVTYLNLISNNKKKFVLAQNDKTQKNAIVHSIYEQITSRSTPHGRFVAKNEDGSYTVKSKDVALQKIKKALNENNATVKAYLERRGMLPDTSSPAIQNKCSAGRGDRKVNNQDKETRVGSSLNTRKMLCPGMGTKFTRQDMLTLYSAISQIDESKIKQIKRHQKERAS